MKWLILPLIFLFACKKNEQEEIAQFQGVAMTMPYQIKIAKPLSISEKKSVQSMIDQTFDRINKNVNHWNPNSELSKINQLKSYEALLVSDDIRALFTLAIQLNKISNEKFDPSLCPLLKQLKSNQAIDTSVSIGLNKFKLKGHVLTKELTHLQLDFDAIAKGYAVDILSKNLAKMGYENTFVVWGGEIKAKGAPSKLRNWNISIRSPHSPHIQDSIAIVPLVDESIATSGDYEQQFTLNSSTKKLVTHIIDPISKKALEITDDSIAAVSVKATSCALADGLATATMLMKGEELSSWLIKIKKEHPEIDIWVIRHNGSSDIN
ncbi:MAG: FAD:protein FMN transferase [Rhabdochlamydiaceae bacterium]|nr:FAD:protein FMN transferase [Candidatus Amphrikana amoebophyrae]